MNIREKLVDLPKKAEGNPIVEFGLYDPMTHTAFYPLAYDGNDTTTCLVKKAKSEIKEVSLDWMEIALRVVPFEIHEKLSVIAML